MNSRFTLAVHMLGLVSYHQTQRGEPATSEQMARSINTNPVVVRRILGDLRDAGLVDTKRGVGGGVRLARKPETITLRDVYEAVDRDCEILALYPNPPSRSCMVGAHIEGFLREVYGEAEEALKQKLAAVTVADLDLELAKRSARCMEDVGQRLA